ncbi:MAG: hypothetical protein ABIR28_03790 [Vicinamibacteria bacterium]
MKSIAGRFTPMVALLGLCGLLFVAKTTEAQQKKVGLYAGYTFLRAEDGNLSGLRLSPEYRVHRLASVVGDLSAEKGTFSSTDTRLLSGLGGLRLKFGAGPTRLFVHALAGPVRVSSSARSAGGVSFSAAATGLGLDGGGGVEFGGGRSFRIRLGADYLRRRVRAPGVVLIANDVRATVGFVF